LVLIAAGALVVLLVLRNSDGGMLAGLLGGDDQPAAVDSTSGDGDPAAEDDMDAPAVEPLPTATPSMQPVVVAKVRLPVGEMITEELLEVEMRPADNIAIQGRYTFSDTMALIGRYPKVDIARGQEILEPMLAINATDVGALGSDLANWIDLGEVAIAFPINRFTGAAFAMRPGDQVDVIMTMRVIETDPVFGTALPNNVERVIQNALLAGEAFLFPPIADGRLEFIPEINQVAAIVPSSIGLEGQDFEVGRPIPKRVTQLTIQQANVLYVGTYFDRQYAEQVLEDTLVNELNRQEAEQLDGNEIILEEFEIDPLPYRIHDRPDVVIISLPAQDALTLKWALERGIDLDLALRSPGDNTNFVTTSVSLPQLLDQGALAFPEQFNFDLFPNLSDVPRPGLVPESIIIGAEITIEETAIEEAEGTP